MKIVIALWILFIGALAIGAGKLTRSRIESDLAARSAIALERGGLPGWRARFEGLDATLIGPAQEAPASPEEPNAREIVSQIEGVHEVVATSYSGVTYRGKASTVTSWTWFRVQDTGQVVKVEGVFATTDALHRAMVKLRSAFPNRSVLNRAEVLPNRTTRVNLSSIFDHPDWLKLVTRFGIRQTDNRIFVQGRIKADGDRAVIQQKILDASGADFSIVDQLIVEGAQSSPER